MGALEMGETFDAVADVIGRDLALVLVAATPPVGARGRRFAFVPKRMKPTHPVARAIGLEAARALAEAFPSILLELPTGERIARRWRQGRAVQVLEGGGTLAEAAAAAGVHKRTVRNAWLDWAGEPYLEVRPPVAPGGRVAG